MSHIIFLIEEYARAQGISVSYVGRLAANDGKLHSRLVSGADTTCRTATRIVQWFSDNWPLGVLWPTDIPRPDPAPDSPHVKALVESTGLTLKEAPIPSEISALALNSKGHLADPRALATSLVFVPTGIDDTELVAAMVGSYYQVVAQYADGKARARKWPRKGNNMDRILTALMEAGDVRFAQRIKREQELLEKFNAPLSGAAG